MCSLIISNSEYIFPSLIIFLMMTFQVTERHRTFIFDIRILPEKGSEWIIMGSIEEKGALVSLPKHSYWFDFLAFLLFDIVFFFFMFFIVP